MEKGKIFVGGLSWDTDKDTLQNYFATYGEVTDCVVMKNPQTGKSRGFGFVTFRDASVVDVVLAGHRHTIDGRNVDCKACTIRGANRPQGGGRGGPGYTGRTTKIFVGGLPNDATDESLKSVFNKFGSVTDVVIMYDQEKSRPRGFGFLTFDNEAAVEAAVEEHFVDFGGKKVECKRAEPRQGGGGNRGGRMGGGYNGDQSWGGMGDGSNWNQYGYAQQGGYGGGGYGGQQGYDQNWAQQSGGYGQGWNQQSYGQGYGQQQNWGGQQTNGQGGYGGYSGHGFSNYNSNDGQGQGYGGYSGQGFSNYGGSGGQGYGGSQDGYGGQSGGGYQPSQGRTGASAGGSTGYHPYKR
ncbi:heterogeneous nuclear ribonucleoprotein 27c [Plakobranchus ocellatus]|uniref:Heterogeneous nuclear ribonucleoprotein 27c n=1 Tax=Plakobranchus ocellatus TaxID=259542 RepID=A0AAV4CV63_9GAST|nr:heterogeneous nuclear ribonucleoprotein 27c [Plakobranchus ocellatus]